MTLYTDIIAQMEHAASAWTFNIPVKQYAPVVET